MKSTPKFIHVMIYLIFFQVIPTHSNAQPLTSLIYDLSVKDYFGDILLTSDGNLLMTGYYLNDSSGFFIGKYDPAGNTIWSHRYDGEYTMGALVETGNGYLLAGYADKKGTVIKYSNEGNILWKKDYKRDTDHRGKIEFSLMKLSANNKIILSGLSGAGFNPFSLIYMSMDTDGTNEELHWLEQNKNLFPVNLIPMKDGGSILLTNSGHNYNLPDDVYPQVYRFDANDLLIWEKKIPLPFNASATGCLLTSDENLLIIGGGTDSSFIMKIDTLGNSIWLQTIALPTIPGNVLLSALTETTGGDFLISGNQMHVLNFQTYFKAMMIRISANGDLLSVKKLETPELVNVRFLKILPDSSGNNFWCGIISNGNFLGPDKQDIYIMETDSSANAGCPVSDTILTFNISQPLLLNNDYPPVNVYPHLISSDSLFEISSIAITSGCPSEFTTALPDDLPVANNQWIVFPNPSNKVIHFKNHSYSGYSVKVYDVYGRLQAIINPSNQTYSLDISTWKSGIYFYQVDEGHQRIEGKFEILR